MFLVYNYIYIAYGLKKVCFEESYCYLLCSICFIFSLFTFPINTYVDDYLHTLHFDYTFVTKTYSSDFPNFLAWNWNLYKSTRLDQGVQEDCKNVAEALGELAGFVNNLRL